MAMFLHTHTTLTTTLEELEYMLEFQNECEDFSSFINQEVLKNGALAFHPNETFHVSKTNCMWWTQFGFKTDKFVK